MLHGTSDAALFSADYDGPRVQPPLAPIWRGRAGLMSLPAPQSTLPPLGNLLEPGRIYDPKRSVSLLDQAASLEAPKDLQQGRPRRVDQRGELVLSDGNGPSLGTGAPRETESRDAHAWARNCRQLLFKRPSPADPPRSAGSRLCA